MPPLAAMAVPIAMGAVGGSAFLGAGASVMQGINAQAAGIQQAKLYGAAAGAERLNYGTQIVSEDYKAGQIISQNEASAGASGVTSTSGSVTSVQRGSAAEQKIRDMYTRYSGEMAARNLEYQGKLAKWQGNQALLAGIMGGGQNILTGGTNMAMIGMKGTTGVGTIGG